MTVLEVVKKYGLEDFSKSYKNVYGQCVDTKYSLSLLRLKQVKGVYIHLPSKEVVITIL